MRRSFLILISFLLPTVANADVDRAREGLAGEALVLAEDVGRWLAANAIKNNKGIAWPDDVRSPDAVSYDLASGVAGKVLYFVALYRATAKSEYRDLALGGADYLASVVQDPSVFEGNLRRASLYSGIAGVGVALFHAQSLAGPGSYADAIADVISLLGEWSVDDGPGVYWSDEFNDLVYGDAGTILFLSWLAEKTDYLRARDLALDGAKYLLGQANETPAGSFWYFRRSQPYNLPNFSHGTAGVSYVLATVGTQNSDESLRRGARAGFDYIKSIAEIEDGKLRIPYGWGSDSWDGTYEFGWAHGLTGTTSMFIRLQQTGIDAESAAEYERLGRHTLANIDLPGTPLSPFAEPSTPLDQRFGRAGVLALVSNWSKGELDSDVAELRDALYSHIERAAIRNGREAYWEVDAPEFMGGGTAAYTGVFHGAAGIGLAILKMHAQMMGLRTYVEFPDYPTK